MDVKVLLCLSLLGLSWFCDARVLVNTNKDTIIVSDSQTNMKQSWNEIQTSKVEKKNQVCTLCEEFTANALIYLSQNKTQTEIIHTLHQSCDKMHSLRKQCISLVDYYAPLFFLEIASIQPVDFCQKFELCEDLASKFQVLSKDSCTLCHRAISEALIKLQDPDTELSIIEILLKACDAAENYAKKCKKMVFEYGPVILVNAEHFLETNDLCVLVHACEAPAKDGLSLPTSKTFLHSSS